MQPSTGSIRVVSKRKGGTTALAHETVIDVDRTNPILGNPHILHNHNDHKERAAVIEARRQDVATDALTNGPIHKELRAIAQRVCGGERVALRCWCSPKPCHADQYAEIIARMAGISVATGARQISLLEEG